MSRNSRILAYGAGALLLAAGVLCAVIFGGLLGPVLALILIGSGLVLLTSLVFLEVGLSEDREREAERRRAERGATGRRPRLSRRRGERLRLK